MPQLQDNQPAEFIVKESATTNILVGSFFLLLSLLILYNFLTHKSTLYNEYASRELIYLLTVTFVPSMIFIIKGVISTVIIVVNTNGFYYYGSLKTNWKNFISINMIEEQITGSYRDNFVLLLRFYDEERAGYFMTKIPMRSTFNRSGEEVIEAVKQFYNVDHLQDMPV